jgi:hypothetical protein
MIGQVTFQIRGAETRAVLDDEARWACPSAPQVAAALNRLLALRLLESPTAEGDPLDTAVVEAAELLRGTYELAPSRSQPDGAVH